MLVIEDIEDKLADICEPSTLEINIQKNAKKFYNKEEISLLSSELF